MSDQVEGLGPLRDAGAYADLPAPVARRPLLRRTVRLPKVLGHTVTLEVWEIVLYGAIALTLLLTRYLALGPRAYHHDESVHAKTFWDLSRGVRYVYDPVYHGPFQYYVTALLFKIFGDSDTVGRILPATFGVALVVSLPFLMGKELGRFGTLLAMATLTLSTGFMYYSRFARNDIYVAFWTAVIFGTLVRYVDRPDRKWILLAGFAMGMSFVTQENTFITGFIFVSFIALLGGWLYLIRRGVLRASEDGPRVQAAFSALGRDVEGVAYGVLIFLGLAVLFMSSFFMNNDGIRVAFVDAVLTWTKVHESQRVNQPWFYYLMFLWTYETFAAVFAFLALPWAVRRPSFFTSLLVYWLVVSFYIYSVAGEKAPWVALHPILPAILLAALFIGRRLEKGRGRSGTWLLGVASVVLLGWTVRNAIPASFTHGDVPLDFIIYTQTSRDVLTAMAIMEEAGKRTGQGRGIPVYLEAESHWPYAWYLRKWTAVTFGQKLDQPPAQPIALMTEESARKLGILMPDYVGVKFKLREWFPEHVYKSWTWGSLVSLFSEGSNLQKLWRFLAFREPPDPIGSTNFVMYLRTDLLKQGPIGPFTYEPPGP